MFSDHERIVIAAEGGLGETHWNFVQSLEENFKKGKRMSCSCRSRMGGCDFVEASADL